MTEIIRILKEQNIPTDSFSSAGIYCNQLNKTIQQYRNLLIQLTTHIPDVTIPLYDNTMEAKLVYAYFCQEAVRAHHSNTELDDSLFELASSKAKHMLDTSPWMWATELEDDTTSTNSSSGTKIERALAIYNDNISLTSAEVRQMFIDEVGLTKGGARAYYQRFKREQKQ